MIIRSRPWQLLRLGNPEILRQVVEAGIVRQTGDIEPLTTFHTLGGTASRFTVR